MKNNKEGIGIYLKKKKKNQYIVPKRIKLLSPKMKQNQPKPRTPKR